MPITISAARDPEAARAILDSLPEWFGIQEANEKYILDVLDEQFDAWVAHDGQQCVGLALVRRHFQCSAELHLLAVHAAHHGTGIGARLVEHVVADLTAKSVTYLTVHTVGPSYDYEPYARTRAFYRAVGFVPLEEHQRLDWDGPTLILLRRLDTPI